MTEGGWTGFLISPLGSLGQGPRETRPYGGDCGAGFLFSMGLSPGMALSYVYGERDGELECRECR